MKQFVMSRYINIRKYFKLIHYPLHFNLNIVEQKVADGFLIYIDYIKQFLSQI